MRVPPLYLTRPLDHIEVEVQIVATRRFWLRLWLTRSLIWLAIWVAGGRVKIEEVEE